MALRTRVSWGPTVCTEARSKRPKISAESIRDLLPVVALVNALLGEPWAAVVAAAAWFVAYLTETWIRNRDKSPALSLESRPALSLESRPPPCIPPPLVPSPAPGAPGSSSAGGAGSPTPSSDAVVEGPIHGAFSMGSVVPFGLALAAFLTVFLAAELFRGGLPVRDAILDSMQSALFCSALLIPLGLPTAVVFLQGRKHAPRRGTGIQNRIAAFQISCCAGMSLATAGAILAGWLPPLTLGQMLWANTAGTALPSLILGSVPVSSSSVPGNPGASLRAYPDCARLFPDILVPGLLSAVLLLGIFRLNLGYSGEASGAVDRARSLGFLALGLVQAGSPLAGLPRLSRAAGLRGLWRPLWVCLGGSIAALTAVAATFWLPPLRSALGLVLPESGETAAVLAGVTAYAVLAAMFRAGLSR